MQIHLQSFAATFSKLLFISSFFLIFPIFLCAEDARPFRIDTEGNKVVDYIADLETNIESLNRQVVGLEEELEKKQIQIEQLNASGREDSPKEIIERDLIKRAEPQVISNSNIENDFYVAKTENENLKKELQVLKDELQSRNDSQRLVEARLEAARQEILGLRSESRAKLDYEKISEEEESRVSQVSSPKVAPESLREQAMQTMRSVILSDLNRVSAVVKNRDKTYQDFKGALKGVAFSPSSPVSQSGESLEKLMERLNSSDSAREFSSVSNSALQIKKKMESDIALINRLKRLN